MDTDYTAPIRQLTPEQAAIRAQQLDDAGETREYVHQDDYFGFDKVDRVYLPDGISYVEHRVFAEGQRRAFLNKSARDVRVEKVSGDAKMRMRPGDERYNLLSTAIVGWNLVSKGQPVVFNDRNLNAWLDSANPRVVDLVEKEVRKANPWLLADISLEDMQKQVDELNEMIVAKKAEEEREAAFR